MTLNLLIPVYNNYKGLVHTISSLNLSSYFQKENFLITVINDCSTDGEDYNKIKDLFAEFYDIQILQTPVNSGPGIARQYGLDNLSRKLDYITFIDAGDIIYSSVELIRYLNIIEQNPDTLVFSAAHQSEESDGSIVYINPFHGRMHGKIYKASFIKEHNIRFTDDPQCSRMNEDIGFNNACKFICDYLTTQNENTPYYVYYESPIVFWTYDQASLTRKDDHSFYYRQNIAVAKNLDYALKLAFDNNVPFSIVQNCIYETMVHLYSFYLSAINVKPEYTEEMFNGALYFYKNIFIKEPIDEKLLTEIFNVVNASYVNKQNDPYNVKIPAISFYEFLIKLEQAYQKELQEKNTENFQKRFTAGQNV